MATRRQLLLLAAGGALWIGGIRALPGLIDRARGFDFAPHPAAPGFRTLAAQPGATSATGAVLAGIDPPQSAATPPADPARDLFDPDALHGTPTAYFFDYFCPYCRVLSADLAALAEDGELAITRHHWPILGRSSDLAARAALAARLQGAEAALDARLIRSPVQVNAAYLRRLAGETGLDWPRLSRDMDSPGVTARLAATRALARLFGFSGTPALVVGRTVIEGEISRPRLSALARLERGA